MSLEMDQSAVDRFDERVEELKRCVAARPADQRMSIRKKTPSHQIHNEKWKESCYRVDVSGFNEVLGFRKRKTLEGDTAVVAVCGGQVTMGQLAKATLAKGFVPKLVPEYSNFTVAGLINGEGIQTSAFKHGVFTNNILSMTVVLGNGEVRVCDDFQNTELYTIMPETYGTMGIVVCAEVELTPSLPFVRSKYTLSNDLSSFISTFNETVKNRQGAFLEGLVLAKNKFLMIESDFISTNEGLPIYDPTPDNFTRGEKWYYQYIEQDVVKGNRVVIEEDAIPTYSFLFRSMRGSWWMTECHINLPWFTKQQWFRKIVDKQTHELIEKHGGFNAIPSKLSMEESQRCVVLQDMGIKLSRLEEGIRWVMKNLGVYPLWLCPVWTKRSRRMRDPKLMKRYHPRLDYSDPENEWIADIGIYGEPTVQPFKHQKTIRSLQEFVDFPSAWGVSYEDPSIIRDRYHDLRTKYHAVGAFPAPEEKTTFRGETDSDEGPIFAWRMVREYGHNWPFKVAGFFIGLFAAIFGLVSLLSMLF